MCGRRFYVLPSRSVRLFPMEAKHYMISGLCTVLAFVGGFLLANSLNRAETTRLRSEIEQAKTSGQSAANTSSELTPEEISSKIEEAERNPQNFQFQKGLGLALYRYGAMKQDPSILGEAIKLLERASGLDPKDYDVIVSLGNAHFDVGFFRKDNDAFSRARGLYGKALEIRPNDVEVRTDIGLTYFLQTPPELERAASEFEKSLGLNPNHEKTLQFYIQTLAKQNRTEKATEQLNKLREINPSNPTIAELTALIANPAAVNTK